MKSFAQTFKTDESLALSGLSDLFVTVELWSEGRRLSLPQRTRHKAFTKSYACGLPALFAGPNMPRLIWLICHALTASGGTSS